MQRAAVSIVSNISKGFERGHPRELHHSLSIAKASCAEVPLQRRVAVDAGYLDEANFQSLMRSAKKIGKIIGGLRVSVERRRKAP
ncbi:four helix bundle protein [Desulfosoma caldarium]|uniref:four helix bundle protein n=1 Tax=Desulfosoma caldarium TaxID=610254 RepID=UPI00319E4750